jgi:hypothetical protein
MSDMTRRISVRIPTSALARLDRLAADRGVSRSAALRVLLEGDASTRRPADRDEAMTLLSESARDGSIPARVALVRALGVDTTTDPLQRRRDELAARRRAREDGA